jgi:HEAT repeat protein
VATQVTDADPIIDLLRTFAIRPGPHRICDYLDALTVFPGEHVAALIQALADPDDEVRLLAVEVFCAMEREAEPALPHLIEALKDKDRLVRVTAVGCISAFGNEAAAAIPILETWLDGHDEFSVVAAAAAIIRIDTSRADDVLPVLIHALDSDDYGIQCHAAWSIGRIGELAREAIPALRQMRGEESTLKHLADEAIKTITGEEL